MCCTTSFRFAAQLAEKSILLKLDSSLYEKNKLPVADSGRPAYTGTTGILYQPQNIIFLAPVIRVFSYIAVTERM
jgi:hypothetical protein